VEQRILKVEHERMMKLLDEQEVQLAEVMHDEIESVKLEAKAQTEAELEEVKAKAEADLEAARRRALTDVEAVRREMKAELDAQVKTQLRQRETELEAKLRETEADARTHEAALKAQLAAEQLVVCVQPLTQPLFSTPQIYKRLESSCLHLHTLDGCGFSRVFLLHGTRARPECTLVSIYI